MLPKPKARPEKLRRLSDEQLQARLGDSTAAVERAREFTAGITATVKVGSREVAAKRFWEAEDAT